MSRHARTTLPPDLASTAAARQFVQHALTGWQGSDAAADVALLTCEVVTNALVHAGTDIELACHIEDGGPGAGPASARVEVTDAGCGRLIPAPGLTPPAGEPAENGRGLFIVDQLADSWGVSYTAGTKSVWFRRLLPAAAPPAGAPLSGQPAARPVTLVLAARPRGPQSR